VERLRAKIRTIPDIPKPAIKFKDITPLVKDPATLRLCLHRLLYPLLAPVTNEKILLTLYQACVIPTLPQRAAAAMGVVDVPNIGAAERPHDSTRPCRRAGRHR
jgi:hypothetical protein